MMYTTNDGTTAAAPNVLKYPIDTPMESSTATEADHKYVAVNMLNPVHDATHGDATLVPSRPPSKPPNHFIDYYVHMPMEAICQYFASDTVEDDAANRAATNDANVPAVSNDTDDSSAAVANNDVMMMAKAVKANADKAMKTEDVMIDTMNGDFMTYAANDVRNADDDSQVTLIDPADAMMNAAPDMITEADAAINAASASEEGTPTEADDVNHVMTKNAAAPAEEDMTMDATDPAIPQHVTTTDATAPAATPADENKEAAPTKEPDAVAPNNAKMNAADMIKARKMRNAVSSDDAPNRSLLMPLHSALAVVQDKTTATTHAMTHATPKEAKATTLDNAASPDVTDSQAALIDGQNMTLDMTNAARTMNATVNVDNTTDTASPAMDAAATSDHNTPTEADANELNALNLATDMTKLLLKPPHSTNPANELDAAAIPAVMLKVANEDHYNDDNAVMKDHNDDNLKDHDDDDDVVQLTTATNDDLMIKDDSDNDDKGDNSDDDDDFKADVDDNV
mmetsp:Transcript_58235/g.69462  ORF Transcript_58235/g.69462 Transcript_58235/m.69462 type:complete len:512 (+) Transcript_58235:225-1760(+)